jgi:hypothetical protein
MLGVNESHMFRPPTVNESYIRSPSLFLLYVSLTCYVSKISREDSEA